MLYPRLIV